MTRRTSVAVLVTVATLGLAAGCKKKDAAATDDCAAAVDHMMTVQLAELSKNMDAKSKAAATTAIIAAKANLTASCKQMKWSKDAIDCVKAVKNDDDAARCDEKLTKEQREAAVKVVDVDTDVPAGSDGSAGSAAAAGSSGATAAASGGTAAGSGGAAAGSGGTAGSAGGAATGSSGGSSGSAAGGAM